MVEGLACIFFLFLYGCFIQAGYSGFKEKYKKEGRLSITDYIAIAGGIFLFVFPFIFIIIAGYEKILIALLGSIVIGGIVFFLYKRE